MSRGSAARGRPTRPKPSAVLLLLLLVMLAGGYWWQRGGQRALDGSLDFTMIYAGARQVVLGGDPYDWEATYQTFERGGGYGRPRDPRWFHSLYPPTTYLLLAPVVGWMDWRAARSVWLLINVGATLAVAGWMWRARPPPVGWVGGLQGVGFWLLATPLHTAVAFGQLSVVVLALLLPSIPLASEKSPAVGVTEAERGRGRRGWWRSAAVVLALGVAVALKPQLALPWLVVRLLLPGRGRGREVLVAVAGLMVLGVVTLAWGRGLAPGWWGHWQAQLHTFAQTGLADPGMHNRFTHQMIHFEPWLRRLLPADRTWAEGWVAIGRLLPVAGLGLAVWWVWRIPDRGGTRRRAAAGGVEAGGGGADVSVEVDDRPWLLLASLTLVVSLMVVYHRGYDGVLLVVPAVWVWREFWKAREQRGPEAGRWGRWWRGGMWLGLGVFLVPWPVGLEMVSRWIWSGHAATVAAVDSPTFYGTEPWGLWLWRLVLVGCQQWLLAVVAGVLVWQVRRRTRRTQRSG